MYEKRHCAGILRSKEMTDKFIKQKIKEINQTKAQVLANYNALCGAEQAYQEMLAELERTEKRTGCQEVKNE